MSKASHIHKISMLNYCRFSWNLMRPDFSVGELLQKSLNYCRFLWNWIGCVVTCFQRWRVIAEYAELLQNFLEFEVLWPDFSVSELLQKMLNCCRFSWHLIGCVVAYFQCRWVVAEDVHSPGRGLQWERTAHKACARGRHGHACGHSDERIEFHSGLLMLLVIT